MGTVRFRLLALLAAVSVPWVAVVACGTSEESGPGPNGTPGDAAVADTTTGGDSTSAGDGGPGSSMDTGSTGNDGSTGDDGDMGGSGDGSAAGGDGAGDSSSGPCIEGCPAGYTCGRYTNPCTGDTFKCGSACTGGKVCVTSGSSQTCETKSCTGKCGIIGVDSCGVGVSCGGCPAGDDCIANACVPAMQQDAGGCSALTCTPNAQTHLCGTITNGCGQTMGCSCPTGQQCIGGVCGTEPPECETDAGTKCGSVANACGSGNIACGNCTGTTQCVAGTCTACTPPSCSGATCGSVSNGCGPAVSCGSCGSGDVCADGGCCAPLTCADLADAGALDGGCAPVALGCNVTKSCAPCATGDVCVNNSCQACVPKTCADFGDAGCDHSDGCGKTVNCCGPGTVCQNVICCPPEQVDYNGTCCQPGCNPTNPATTQESCGLVISCGGN